MKIIKYIVLFFILIYGIAILTNQYKPTYILKPLSLEINELNEVEILDIEHLRDDLFYLLANNKKIYEVNTKTNNIIETFSLDELHNPTKFIASYHSFLVIDKLDNQRKNIVAYQFYFSDFHLSYKNGSCIQFYGNSKQLKKYFKVLNNYEDDINDILFANIDSDGKCLLTKNFLNYEIAHLTNSYELKVSIEKTDKLLPPEKQTIKAFENLISKKSIIDNIAPKEWSVSSNSNYNTGSDFVLTDTENKAIYIVSNINHYKMYGDKTHYFKDIYVVKTTHKPLCSAIKYKGMNGLTPEYIMVANKGEKGVSYNKVEYSIVSKFILEINKICKTIISIPIVPFMGRQ